MTGNGATYTQYSVINIPANCTSRLHFPGNEHVPVNSQGYVRSQSMAEQSVIYGAKDRPPIPFRDYPDNVRVEIMGHLQKSDMNRLLISARNVLNEYSYAARIGDSIFSKQGFSMQKHSTWPVLAVGQTGLRMASLTELWSKDQDLLGGLPLVIDGQSMSRDFFLTNCSDMAHVFDVHPKGLAGTSAQAWLVLSNLWQSEKDAGSSEQEISALMMKQAKMLDVMPSYRLLHSCIGLKNNGDFIFLATTGSLDDIAEHLSDKCDVQHAFVLDNGGSVGPVFVPANTLDEKLLVAAPNRRPLGTVFIEIEIEEYLQPSPYEYL